MLLRTLPQARPLTTFHKVQIPNPTFPQTLVSNYNSYTSSSYTLSPSPITRAIHHLRPINCGNQWSVSIDLWTQSMYWDWPSAECIKYTHHTDWPELTNQLSGFAHWRMGHTDRPNFTLLVDLWPCPLDQMCSVHIPFSPDGRARGMVVWSPLVSQTYHKQS